MSCLWFASIRHAPGSPLSCWCERSPFAWLAECECVSLSPSVSTYLWKYHSDLTLEVRSTCTPITPQLITSACTRRAPHNSFVRVCVALDLFANGLLSLSSSPSDLYQSHFLIAAIRLGVRKPQMRWSAFGFVPKNVCCRQHHELHTGSHTHTLAVIYQTSTKTGADSGVKKSSYAGVHLRFMKRAYLDFRMSGVLINAVAENNRPLSNTPLFIHGLARLTSKKRNLQHVPTEVVTAVLAFMTDFQFIHPWYSISPVA